MTTKAEKAPQKLTDAERHKRFVEMAQEVGASKDPKAFDAALKKVAGSTGSKSPRKES